MPKKFKTVLYIFRRDLRLEDNSALIQASADADYIIPCFIIDPRQTGTNNTYRSLNAIQFMREALEDLAQKIKAQGGRLYIWTGQPEEVFARIIKDVPIDALYLNRDYTPFSINRDQDLKKLCHQHKMEFVEIHDLLLTEPESITTINGTPYTIFTPFFKRARQAPVQEPHVAPIRNWYTEPIKGSVKEVDSAFEPYNNSRLHVHGIEANAATILKNIHAFEHYGQTHDYPAQATTNLSAYIKFGMVSIRRVYHAILKELGPSSPIIRQLYWRDFFTHIAYESPFVFGQPFKERYQNLPWRNEHNQFEAWCQGRTGFPIIDAGMRQLNETGYMHNRVRLLVSSFLVKDLHIDWLLGEQYFAQHLVDYDPAVNNGNWQWVASTGTDSQPYFRIFNPWLQQKKFDPDCRYIKKWVPELANFDSAAIGTWFKAHDGLSKKYPRPIVDHATESALAKQFYKQAPGS